MPTTGTMRYLTIGDSTYEVYNTDTEVIQTYAAASGYTNWRPLVVGYSSNSSETTAPTTITGTTYTFNTIKVKPSDGIIRFGAAALYNGDYTTTISADTLTAARTLTAPDKSGTIALTSDIPSLTGYATTTYVDTAIAALPEPMIFKGSLGTGGTITSLPAASSLNEGFTYKVITDGTYASQEAKVGDTFISDGSSWILIPSGDEPSGTVTSVGVSNDTYGGLSVSGSPITSSGTITIGHSNILTSAQTTQAVYPIKIDKNGHISEYGSAVTIPTKVSDLTNDSGFITGMTILSYGTSTWNDFLTAYNANKVVYCRASSNSNPATGSQTRLAFMAYVNDATNPTNVEFQYYRSVNTHSESQQGDQVYVYKLTSAGSWTVTVRENYTKIAAGGSLTQSYSSNNGTLTISGTIPTISLNGSSTTSASFYAPTTAGTSGYYLKSNGSGAPTWSAISDEIFIAEYNSTTYADVLAAYNAGKTIICKEIFSSATTYYAYLEKCIDNTFYFATPGENNNGSKAIYTYTLTSNGTWSSDDISLNIPSITLNGSATTSPSFYAPTTAGTSGYVLTSSGSGAPTWAAAPSSSSYTATSPIDITGNDISHEDSGVTAGTYDGGGVKSTGFYVPSITVDAKGHVTSATDLGNLIPVVTSSNSNENGNVIGTRTWALATRSYSAYPSVLAAGNTSKTITISSDSNSAYTYAKYFRVVDVEAFDAVTKEPVIVDWSASALYSNNSSVTVTVSIASAYTNNIWLYVLLSVGYGSM